jgi:hypothetical protein
MYRTTTMSPTRRRHGQLRTIAAGAALVATSAMLTASPATAGDTANGYPGEEPFSRACFMEQAHWNEALDGPQPRCPAPESDTGDPGSGGDPDPVSGHVKLRRS